MSRKGENIYKRKDGRWEGRYIKSRLADGKAKYGYVYARSYRDLKSKLAYTTVSKVHKPAETTLSEDVCLQSVAEDWFYMTRSHIKDSTGAKYRNLLKSYILPSLGNLPLRDLTQECIERFCNNLLLSGGRKGTGLSPKTVADILSLLRNILRYSFNKGFAPSYDIKSISIKQHMTQIHVFSRKEQEKLCRYIFQNISAKNIGILICLFTGLRVGEICALRWEDISLSEKTIFVHQTMQRIQLEHPVDKKTLVIISTPKSNCSVRTIPIPDELVKILSDFCDNKNGFVLTGDETKYIEPRTMQKHFKRVLLNSGVGDANYHALRHTFATRCVEVGFDIKSLSEILGHANISITMNRYVHPSMELKRVNMQRLASLFTVN